MIGTDRRDIIGSNGRLLLTISTANHYREPKDEAT